MATDFGSYDHLRTWESGAYRLELYDTLQTHWSNKSLLAYQFYHDGQMVFAGADYGCSPCHSIDGDLSVAGLLTFLSLRPGDTDREYFRDYTSDQMAFAQEFGEELGHLAMELEEESARESAD